MLGSNRKLKIGITVAVIWEFLNVTSLSLTCFLLELGRSLNLQALNVHVYADTVGHIYNIYDLVAKTYLFGALFFSVL